MERKYLGGELFFTINKCWLFYHGHCPAMGVANVVDNLVNSVLGCWNKQLDYCIVCSKEKFPMVHGDGLMRVWIERMIANHNFFKRSSVKLKILLQPRKNAKN